MAQMAQLMRTICDVHVRSLSTRPSHFTLSVKPSVIKDNFESPPIRSELLVKKGKVSYAITSY